GLIFLNEAGLDPGIDHMSAMQLIDGFKKAGEEILSFRSYCGGLVAPESNDNPWGYKFSWNPRNVVLAGQGGDAQYLEQGALKTIPYEKLFEQTETIEVSGYGRFEAYANRDSLSYRQPYGLEEIPTLLRGTLRMPGFCRAWNALIRLGLTDDTKSIPDSDQLTWEQLIHRLNPVITADLAAQIHGNSEVFSRLEWLGIFSDRKIPLKNATPAQILQELLEEKWALKPHDKDMIVMQHIFETRNKKKEIRKVKSSLVVIGDDQVYTAMAKTVGLPLAICVKLILQGKIKARGVVIPVLKEIYTPVLKELADNGIRFQEKQMN
ncbi:MAG: saccharopine dehydrogenase C-terminal domain-containing protein, partial [Bacteroidota bacterium]